MCAIECQKKGRVLIIDDQPDNIHVLGNILKEDYDILAATSGFKALEIASGNNPPDVILLDIVMPEMDGYEVCRRLKADEQNGNGLPENFDMNKSAGLGLMLVQGLTQQLHGTFTISSDHGVKSVVTFEI